MASSCSEQRQSLLECLADCDCIAQGKSIKECVTLPVDASGCKELNRAWFECKRGQLDMRKRIKGNMPDNYQGEGPEPEPQQPPQKDSSSKR